MIHKFHQGPARDLFVRYNPNMLEHPVAYALVSGVLDRANVPPELLEHLSRVIDFYNAEETRP
ncbi:MAG: hypothetical protein ACRELA_11015 [Candidatus Rokuibacteriota bacterium]